jgi:hypothetical protein
MIDDVEASDSYDPRSWLRGYAEEPSPAGEETPAVAKEPRSRILLAGAAAAAILLTGGAAAYLTRPAQTFNAAPSLQPAATQR